MRSAHLLAYVLFNGALVAPARPGGQFRSSRQHERMP
jgi:hypothetical protein